MTQALTSLRSQLSDVIRTLIGELGEVGHPVVVRRASEESERLFQGYAKAKPAREDAYAAAVALVRNQELDERQRDLVASALTMKVREQEGARPIGHDRLHTLLKLYESDAENGSLWRLTWFGLLGSYFSFEVDNATEADRNGWQALRELLRNTWPFIDRQSGQGLVPDWVRALRAEPDLLDDTAAARYAMDYLKGEDAAVKQLSTDLGIPEASWFWHALVLSTVHSSARQSDERFKANIPRLLELIEQRPVVRDEGLAEILTRYHRCSSQPSHAQLRDYVVRSDIWRNPKLHVAGIATKWHQVSEPVYRMVLQWVNERNLKDFFEILAARNRADEGRLEFWTRYLNHVSWTRLIFSAQTVRLARSNRAIRELIASEDGAYAQMWGNSEVDAFMMQIGNHIVVEFSKQPNAAYVYRADRLRFDRSASHYAGTQDDLKFGYGSKNALRITHQSGWQAGAEYELGKLGIHPDAKSKATLKAVSERTCPDAKSKTTLKAVSERTWRDLEAPHNAPFTMERLAEFVSQYPSARIDDRRTSPSIGRLWVQDPMHYQALSAQLRAWGFRWADSQQSYYYSNQ